MRSRPKAETSKWSEAAIFWIEKPKGKNQIILGNIFKPWDSKICEGECFFALLGRFIIALHTKNKFFLWKVTVFKVLYKKVLFLKKKGVKGWKMVENSVISIFEGVYSLILMKKVRKTHKNEQQFEKFFFPV